jgi:hypothetical protein
MVPFNLIHLNKYVLLFGAPLARVMLYYTILTMLSFILDYGYLLLPHMCVYAMDLALVETLKNYFKQ